jgi:hypothetical protein
MSDESIRLLITVVPAAGTLLFVARYLLQLQKAVTARFEHLIHVLRDDIVGLERANERLELRLTLERDARRADNHRCDEQITELRRRLAQFTPPYGIPPTKENP